MTSILRLVSIPNRELCRPRIVPIPLCDSELPIENQHILLPVHDFLDVCPAERGTLGLRLLIQQVLHLK